MTDPLKDSDVGNDEASGSLAVGGTGVHGDWSGWGGSGAVEVGGYDVLRVDPTQDVPLASDLVGAAHSASKLASGDGDWTDLADIAGNVANLGLNVVTYAADPLNYLISAGLTFLIDVVQPLEDLLGLVTGNPERMDGEIAKWERVANALEPLAKDIRSATDNNLVGWEGKTAEAAKKRLHDFADGVAGLADDVKQVQMVMTIAKTLMGIAQAFVIGLLATFVEWLVFTWVPALAAAAPTFGASTAAAGAATTAEAASVTARAVSFIDRVVMLLRRLRTVLYRIHPRLMRRVQTTFQVRGPNGRFQTGWNPANVAFKNLVKDWRTWAPAGLQTANSAAHSGKTIDDSAQHDRKLPDSTLDKDLDPNQ
jgi:hypothetical protein